MVERIVTRFAPERVILFGSHARGTAGPDSDVDLLVVMEVEGSLRRTATEIDRALTDRELPLDLVVVTPETFERDRDQIGTIVRPAAQEGKVLYERAA
jgi:predicted nucleotidyltransferase